MPNPIVFHDRETGLLLDVRRVVEGTARWNGKDGFEFCIGEETSMKENSRTYRIKVSSEDGERIALYINGHLHAVE